MRTRSSALHRTGRDQGGFALVVLLALLTAGVLYFLVEQLDAAAAQRLREEATSAALAEAKHALIAYAVAVSLDGSGRPGDLPCPDRDNDGRKGTGAAPGCGNAAGTTFQERRLGRLPWLDLGLRDLRDGSGERLWYAVSTNFKENTRRVPLNSDSLGTITVRDPSGRLLADASGTTGAVAVIIAPGAPLLRQDGLQQDRSVANSNDPLHYLDVWGGEDNADFDEIVTKTNGFIAGPVPDPADAARAAVNDRLIVVTRGEIMAAIEKRVAGEVLRCLTKYASHPANQGRYPWAVDLPSSATGGNEDVAGTFFGRVPLMMCNTGGDGITPPCDSPAIVGSAPGMLTTWGSVGNCHITSTWFTQNWSEQVFYGIADAYKPGVGPPACGTCLSIDALGGYQLVVLVAGKASSSQSRTTIADKANASQYLEDINNTGSSAYVSKSAIPDFNDLLQRR